MRWAMIIVAAVGLVLSVMVHLSTIFGVDPIAVVPGVFWLHVLMFPPFAAGIVYTNRAIGKKGGGLESVMAAAPKWLVIMTACLFAYAFINYILFIVLQEGSPAVESGRYYLQSHGDMIREITEAEYHHAEALDARGFSGHWMLFYSVSVMMLLGSDRILRDVVSPATSDDARKHWWEEPEPTPGQIAHNKAELAKPISKPDAITSIAVFLICALILIWGQPALCLMVALVFSSYGLGYLRRAKMGQSELFESSLGCLALIPIMILFLRMIKVLGNAIYIAIAVSPIEAARGAVWIVRENESMHFSNGDPIIHYWVYNAATIFVAFAGFIFCFSGMVHLVDSFGRWLKHKKITQKLHQSPQRLDHD